MLLISSCIIISCSAIKPAPDPEFYRYSVAYKYIVKHNQNLRKARVRTIDSLEATQLLDFYLEIARDWKLKERNIVDKLDSIDKSAPNPVYKPWLKRLTNSPSKPPKFVVSFSKTFNNYFTAEVLSVISPKYNSANAQRPVFGRSTIYLFAFGKNNEIIKVYSYELAYN